MYKINRKEREERTVGKNGTFISRTTIERIRSRPHMEIRDELTARNHPITHKTAPQKSSGWSSVHKQDRRRCCCCRCDMHSYDRREKEEEEDRQMYFLRREINEYNDELM